jgi:hypothetical protein
MSKRRTIPKTDLNTLTGVCRAAKRAGLYFARVAPGEYLLRAEGRLQDVPELVAALRQYKPQIVAMLDAHIATDLFTATPATVVCPVCQQPVYEWQDTDPPQRARHLAPDGLGWCGQPVPVPAPQEEEC